MIYVYKNSPMEKYLKSINYLPNAYQILDDKPAEENILYALTVTGDSGEVVDDKLLIGFTTANT